MDGILFGKDLCLLSCSWREGRMSPSLSWRQVKKTSVDAVSCEKSGDLIWRAAALPGESWGLRTSPWIEVEERMTSSPAEKLLSVSRSKAACSVFSLL